MKLPVCQLLMLHEIHSDGHTHAFHTVVFVVIYSTTNHLLHERCSVKPKGFQCLGSDRRSLNFLEQSSDLSSAPSVKGYGY